MRKEAREVAFKLIYEKIFNEDMDIENSFSFLCDEACLDSDESKAFIMSIYNSFIENREKIENIIDKNLVGYERNRIYKIDLSLIIIAIIEIDSIKTPPAVAVNEVLELAKKYSTDKSPSFINGFLSTLYKE